MRLIKTAFLVVPIVLSPLVAANAPAQESKCVDADPTLTLAGIKGDWELSVDPQDPAGGMIFASNVVFGEPSSVVVARLDGKTGMVEPSSLTQIATNFFVKQPKTNGRNGPEFAFTPQGNFGFLYASNDGVHGAFRSAVPAAWNDFKFDANGVRFRGNPPALPATDDGAINAPSPSPPLQASTYGEFGGTCVGMCFGALGFGATTSVNTVALAQYGVTVTESTQSVNDGYVFFSGCDGSGFCGIYEGLIDNAGGFVPGTVHAVAQTSGSAAQQTDLVASRHPVTGTTILFSGDGQWVYVWEQHNAGDPLTLMGWTAIVEGDPSQHLGLHFRAEASNTQVVLNYLIDSGASAGSYTVPVSENAGALVVGPSKLVGADWQLSEVDWLPAANKWAFFHFNHGRFIRCWIRP